MTRGRLLDRIRVALAGHIAVRVVLGQETNLSLPGGYVCLTITRATMICVIMWPLCGSVMCEHYV
jgi:hypothetical protein